MYSFIVVILMQHFHTFMFFQFLKKHSVMWEVQFKK